MTESVSFEAQVDAVLARSARRRNRYLDGLEDGSLSRAAFLAGQRQFRFAVEHFHRPMAILAGRLPDAAQRAAILRNVWEENGEGVASASHGATFAELLRRLGLSDAEIHATAPSPATLQFLAVLDGVTGIADVREGAAAMGIIERMFIGYSRRLARGIVARGWLSAGQMIHYDLHETLDVRHAEDFFAISRMAFVDEGGRAETWRGLSLGAYAFDAYFDALTEEG